MFFFPWQIHFDMPLADTLVWHLPPMHLLLKSSTSHVCCNPFLFLSPLPPSIHPSRSRITFPHTTFCSYKVTRRSTRKCLWYYYIKNMWHHESMLYILSMGGSDGNLNTNPFLLVYAMFYQFNFAKHLFDSLLTSKYSFHSSWIRKIATVKHQITSEIIDCGFWTATVRSSIR